MIKKTKHPVISKYLTSYAEKEAALTLPDKKYEYCLVIPAFKETRQSLVTVWRQIKPGTSFLVILVINSDKAEDLSARILFNAITGTKVTQRLTDQIQLVHSSKNSRDPDILLVDRFSSCRVIPNKQGVGLARKIGMDIATSLINQGTISREWLFTTDADAELPCNYFNIATSASDAAFLFPFKHLPEPNLSLPIALYELSIFYYACGLLWANSPYAYPAVGSTISCSPHQYAAVRGFPKRNTGEDFYLLNKLRKTGNVKLGDGPPVILSGRFSDRVPIGTGQAIKKINQMRSPPNEFTVEHPDCFSKLKFFMERLNSSSLAQPKQFTTGDAEIDFYIQKIGLLRHYENKRKQSPAPLVMQKHLHDWFDALKTRQFIHHFRDMYFGRISITDISVAPFLPHLRWGRGDLNTYLEEAKNALCAFIYHQ